MIAIILGSIFVAVILGLLVFGTLVYQRNKHRQCTSKKLLHGKTALVTGGTAGMGLEVATDLARRGAMVIIASPYPSEGETAVQHITNKTGSTKVDFLLMDLGSLEDTRRAAKEIIANYDSLHLLINNAGIGGPTDITKNGFNRVIQVNYLGPALLTILLTPLLNRSCQDEPSRVVNVASFLHNSGTFNAVSWKKSYSGLKSYSDSKLCLVMLTRELAKRLKSVVVNVLEPGTVSTHIYTTWNPCLGPILTWAASVLLKTPWQGAQTTLHVSLDDKAGDVTGQYFIECQLSKPSAKAENDTESINLWEETVKAVQLSDDEIKLVRHPNNA